MEQAKEVTDGLFFHFWGVNKQVGDTLLLESTGILHDMGPLNQSTTKACWEDVPSLTLPQRIWLIFFLLCVSLFFAFLLIVFLWAWPFLHSPVTANQLLPIVLLIDPDYFSPPESGHPSLHLHQLSHCFAVFRVLFATLWHFAFH